MVRKLNTFENTKLVNCNYYGNYYGNYSKINLNLVTAKDGENKSSFALFTVLLKDGNNF